MTKKSKLSLDDRINLLAAITKGKNLTQIAKQFNRPRSTFYREIKKHMYWPTHPYTCSYCNNKFNCPVKKGISQKHWICPNFKPLLCEKQKHFPFVCNNCPNMTRCSRAKCYYNCTAAYNTFRTNWCADRSKISLYPELLNKLNEIVTSGIRKGQSIHHIHSSNEWVRGLVSEVTIRRYLYKGLFDAKPIELPRYKRYSRKYNYSPYKNFYIWNIKAKENRTFSDFKNFCKVNHIEKNYWEYDSVEGNCKSKKSIFTITFAENNFQFGFLIRKHNPNDVYKICRWLQETFPNLFKVNLADNGVEFVNFHKIEKAESGEHVANVFFTSTYKATDKPHCERNHEFIRYIAPKGTSFDGWTQDQVNLMFSHINSYVRESLNNKTPYDLIVERFGIEFTNKLGIFKIKPENVCLNSKVFN